MPALLPIAVLVSGSGSNLQALIDAQIRGEVAVSIAVVISDQPEAFGIERAERAGISTEIVPRGDFANRAQFTEAICDAASRHGAEGLVLAGFMRILSPVAIDRFPQAIINVHPALLPAFPGPDAVSQAITHGVALTGVTVHFVDEKVDHGPIIAQQAVTVLPTDDEASLHARIQGVEHSLLPAVVDAFGRGDLSVDGRTVRWRSAAPVDEKVS